MKDVEDLPTEDENIEKPKIDEQHKFSLDAEFIWQVWILQKRKMLKFGFMIW